MSPVSEYWLEVFDGGLSVDPFPPPFLSPLSHDHGRMFYPFKGSTSHLVIEGLPVAILD